MFHPVPRKDSLVARLLPLQLRSAKLNNTQIQKVWLSPYILTVYAPTFCGCSLTDRPPISSTQVFDVVSLRSPFENPLDLLVVTRDLLLTLEPGCMLNTTIIDAYGELILRRNEASGSDGRVLVEIVNRFYEIEVGQVWPESSFPLKDPKVCTPISLSVLSFLTDARFSPHARTSSFTTVQARLTSSCFQSTSPSVQHPPAAPIYQGTPSCSLFASKRRDSSITIQWELVGSRRCLRSVLNPSPPAFYRITDQFTRCLKRS